MDFSKSKCGSGTLDGERANLNEDPSQVPDQIKSLRLRIQEDPDLKFRTDDAFLIRFLRARKFNQDRALELITNYYKQREKYPELFKKQTNSQLENIMSAVNFHGVIFKRDGPGRALLVYNSFLHWDPAQTSVDQVFLQSLMSLEKVTEEEDVQIDGLTVLIDLKGFSMSHVVVITLRVLKRSIALMLNAFPVRYREIHFINEPYLFDIVFFMMKPLLSRKLLSRIKFHGSSVETLHQFVPPDVLPAEFGGNLGPFDNSAWNQVLKANVETWNKNLAYGFVTHRQ